MDSPQDRVGGVDTAADVAQSRSALAGLRANLMPPEADVLQRKAALRNILGLPPYEPCSCVPGPRHRTNRLVADWERIAAVAAQQRPDLIELKLILEADQQQLLVAQQQRPAAGRCDGLYRWNGLEGRRPAATESHPPRAVPPIGRWASTSPCHWAAAGRRPASPAGVDPGPRPGQSRPGPARGVHDLATSSATSIVLRAVPGVRRAREAARVNLDRQAAAFRAGRTILLNVLQAIADWGNSVSAEAQTLAQYNTELAGLERTTGTILETHGVRFIRNIFSSWTSRSRVSPCSLLSPVVAADGEPRRLSRHRSAGGGF